jgi:beta-lactamase regulating signal transducer with metallopeptidase domain
MNIFIEAALRSLLFGFAVAAGLRIFRVRNVPAQKATWGLVLVFSIAMPLLLPITSGWHLLPRRFNLPLPAHPMTLLEELQARIQAKAGSAVKLTQSSAPIHHNYPPNSQESPAVEQGTAAPAGEGPSRPTIVHRALSAERDARSGRENAGFSSAQPAAHNRSSIQEPQSLGSSRRITVSPDLVVVTLYFAITGFFLVRLALALLATIRLWRAAAPVPVQDLPYESGLLRVRASSQVASPFTIGSAILLPADFMSWDREKLRIVLAHERSHIRQGDFYLQMLAGFYSALVWFSPLGWWLRRELAELAEAISDRAGLEEAASTTSYAQILLEFAAAPRRVPIGVAMARPGSLSRRIERLLNDHSFRQCFDGGRRALVAVVLVPLALLASVTLAPVQAAAGRQSHPPVPAAAPGSLAAPAAPAVSPALAAPAGISEAFATKSPEISVTHSEVVAVASPVPAPFVTMVAGGQENGALSFDRTLSVSAAPSLAVLTGSGNIQITRGAGNQIHIHGQIHVNENGSEEQARQIAANPPIEQSGDSVSVGQHQEQWHGISIDYRIEAPAGTLLTAHSGSGNIVDEGVGQNAKLQTGSGDIDATGLEGPFTVKTGSGNIVAEQSGQGDVVAETGSGDIELKEIHGSFRGQTGSGDIKASGAPSSSWTLQTGSGNIELWTGNAPLTLDASTGSGSVTTDHEMMVQGAFDHHHVRGTLNGGGPTVRVQTGSGDVHIH